VESPAMSESPSCLRLACSDIVNIFWK
jgi:hypothetical protein